MGSVFLLVPVPIGGREYRLHLAGRCARPVWGARTARHKCEQVVVAVCVMRSNVPPLPRFNALPAYAPRGRSGCARRGDSVAVEWLGACIGADPPTGPHCVLCAAQTVARGRVVDGDPVLGASRERAACAAECERESCGHLCRYGIVVRVGFMLDGCRARTKWH